MNNRKLFSFLVLIGVLLSASVGCKKDLLTETPIEVPETPDPPPPPVDTCRNIEIHINVDSIHALAFPPFIVDTICKCDTVTLIPDITTPDLNFIGWLNDTTIDFEFHKDSIVSNSHFFLLMEDQSSFPIFDYWISIELEFQDCN